MATAPLQPPVRPLPPWYRRALPYLWTHSLSLPLGLIFLVIGYFWNPDLLSHYVRSTLVIAGYILILITVLTGLCAYRYTAPVTNDLHRYNRHLCGIGYTLLLVGVVWSVIIAALLSGGAFGYSAYEFNKRLSTPASILPAAATNRATEHTQPSTPDEPVESPEPTSAPATSSAPATTSSENSGAEDSDLDGSLALAAKSAAPPGPTDPCTPTALTTLAALALIPLLSASAAVAGALFFVADSLRRKRRGHLAATTATMSPPPPPGSGATTTAPPTSEPFDPSLFWGGLWFRLGEAVLFSLVLFWLTWVMQPPPDKIPVGAGLIVAGDRQLDYTWLPLFSLLSGMFIKSAERLVSSIYRGFARAIAAFFNLPDDNTDGEA